MRFAFGGFLLDLGQRRLFAGDGEVHLQPKAFEMLKALVEARPRALSTDELLALVWPETNVSENNLATVVRDLRDALNDAAQEPTFIRTAYGFGYAFIGAVTALDGTDALPVGSGWRLIHAHRVVRLNEGANLLGRSGPDVLVFDAATVSRHHALVRVHGPHATVEDLGSKNGTWLGVTRVHGPAPLGDGAEVRLGSLVVVARFTSKAPTTETAASRHEMP